MNNSYIRKIHKQRSINYEKYVRGYFKVIIISLVEAYSGIQGWLLEPRKTAAKVFKNGQENP